MRPTTPKRNVPMGAAIRSAIETLESEHRARLTYDSGHTDGPSTWIFDFDGRGDAQLALRTNRSKLSMYLRATGRDGRAMRAVVEALGVVEDEYPVTAPTPPHSLLGAQRAPGLCPSAGSRLLRVSLRLEHLREVMDQYLGLRPASAA